MPLNRNEEIELVLDLTCRAGERVMRWRGCAREELKEGVEPVTAADREADAFLVEALSEAFPEDDILAEESGATRPASTSRIESGMKAPPAPRRWCIDPVDGTKEFIEGLDQFAVMVGLAEAGAAALGVVLLPARGIVYWGGPELGAFRRRLPDGEPEQLRVSGVEAPSRMTMAVSRSHRSSAVDRAARLLRIEREVRSGSVGVKLGMVATGEADLYLHPASGTRLWDACAPDALVRGAGGVLTDCRGRPIPYESEDAINSSGLVASNGACHEAIVEALAPIVEEEEL